MLYALPKTHVRPMVCISSPHHKVTVILPFRFIICPFVTVLQDAVLQCGDPARACELVAG